MPFPLLILILIFIAIFVPFFRKRSSHPPARESDSPIDVWDTGKTGERYTKEVLQPLTGYKQFLSNCYLPKPDETFTEVDLILLHESGIYVIESKNYSGWIFGSEDQKNWTQSLPSSHRQSKKVQFFNPILQNKGHLKWLKKYLDIGGDVPCYSFVVFSDRCELKKVELTSGAHFVVNRRNLLQKVQKNAETVGQKLTREEIDAFYRRLYPLTQVSEEQKALHAETVRQKQKKTAASKPAPIPTAPKAVEPPPKQEERICPRCGGKLVVRTAKKGERVGEQFWGCSSYPKCHYTEKIKETATAQ